MKRVITSLCVDADQRTVIAELLGLPTQSSEADILAALVSSGTTLEQIVALRKMLQPPPPPPPPPLPPRRRGPRLVDEIQCDIQELRTLCHHYVYHASCKWRVRILARVIGSPSVAQLADTIDGASASSLLLLLCHCEAIHTL